MYVDADGIGSIVSPSDTQRTQFVRQGERYNTAKLTYEYGKKLYMLDSTELASDEALVRRDDSTEVRFIYHDPNRVVRLEMLYVLNKDYLDTCLTIENVTAESVELLDLSTYLPTNTHFEWHVPAGDKVIGHTFIGGHGSYIYSKRCDGLPPFLLLMPQGQTLLEYMDTAEGKITHQEEHNGEFYGLRHETFLNVYILSANACKAALENGSKLRHPNSSVTLQPGRKTRIEFRYTWAYSDDEVREKLTENQSLDILAVPGYTLPVDMSAKLSVRSGYRDLRLVPEFPDSTEIELLGRENGREIYRIQFHKLGENKLTCRYDGGSKWTNAQFFVTEPVRTLISKRADFLVKTRCIDGGKWYYGLLCEWNNKTNIQLSPDNYDEISGWRIYEVASDDAAFGKPAFLATKLVEQPVQSEIDAIDDYIEYYVWGGLQMTEDEEYPYAVYGTPDWHAHRTSEDPGPGLTSRGARLHFWRIYDYPHIFLMYFNMYRVARDYPSMRTRLSKEEYLKRAYKTAWAMFIYPFEVDAWSADYTGLMNELVIEDIIAELHKTGHELWAQRLQFHWNRKIRNFVVDNIDVFGSEYPFDTTGFETTHAIAKSALKSSIDYKEQFGLPRRWPITKDKAVKFMQKQITSNYSCRGTIEPAFFWYGSDYRAQNYKTLLSYMSQMGGWAILDYALHYAEDPFEYLRVGYGSMLSSWSLINTGNEKSNYGYWFPGKDLDGAACGAYEALPYGTTWLGQKHHGGGWYYSGESDGGFCAGVRGMATILADDPIFGLFCYGGVVSERDGRYLVDARDGVNRRFHYISKSGKLHFTIDHGHISEQTPVSLSKELTEVVLPVDCSLVIGTSIEVTVSAQQFGKWILNLDGAYIGTFEQFDGGKVQFPATCERHTITLQRL